MPLIIAPSHEHTRLNKIVKSKTSGFSLLELLLVVSIAAGIGFVVVQIFDDFAKTNANRLAATQILRLQNAAEEYVLAEFNAILAGVPNVGDINEIPPNELAVNGYLPAAFVATNSFKQNATTLVRNVGVTVDGLTIEVVSVTEDTGATADGSGYPNDRIWDAAISGGPKVGVIIDLDTGPTCCEDTIQSVYGEWSLDLADFSAEFAYTDTAGRGYLAAYGRVAFSNTFNEELLYRSEITGRPELNQMRTNMYMDGNDISNAGVITADNVSVGYAYDDAAGTWGTVAGGDVVINGSGAGTGNFTPFALTIDQAVNVDGDTNINLRVSDLTAGAGCSIVGGIVTAAVGTAATDCAIEGGEIFVKGDDAAGTNDFTANSLTIIGDAGNPGLLSVTEAADGATQTIDVTSVTGTGISSNFNEVTASGNVTATDFNTFTFNAGVNGIPLTNFNLQGLQASVANLGGLDLTVDNIIAGRVDLGGGSLSVPNAFVTGAVNSGGTLSATTINAAEKLLIDNTIGCNATNGCPAF